MQDKKSNIITDSLGDIEIPIGVLYGAQTQRAIDNFPLSGIPMPKEFIQALGLIKSACANTNYKLGGLDKNIADAIEKAALEIANGKHIEQFPIDIFQTGSGTSTNMNANEVIANLASDYSDREVHPNDHAKWHYANQPDLSQHHTQHPRLSVDQYSRHLV